MTDPPAVKRARVYNGPKKGSPEAKNMMAKVRAAQFKKHTEQQQQQYATPTTPAS